MELSVHIVLALHGSQFKEYMEDKIVTPIQRSTPLVSPPIEEQPANPPGDANDGEGGSLAPQDHYLTSPSFYEVTNYFGVEHAEFEQAKHKLSAIVDWAAEESKSGNLEDILMKIRMLEEKIQPPQWGERRYQNVYKYVRLASKQQALGKAMSAFEKMPARR